MISSTRLTNWCEGFIRLDFFQGLSHLPRPIPRPTNVPSLPLGKIIPVLGTLLDQELVSNPFSIPIDFRGVGLGDDVDVGRNVCEWAINLCQCRAKANAIVTLLQTDHSKRNPSNGRPREIYFTWNWLHVYFQRKLLSLCVHLSLVFRVRLYWNESGSESDIAFR